MHTAPATPTPQDDSKEIQLVWIDENGITHVGNIFALADHIDMSHQVGDGSPVTVYTVTDGDLIKVEWEVGQTPMDEDNYAAGSVTVTMPNQHKITSFWTVDGRA